MSKQTTPANESVASQKPRLGFWQHRWVQDGVPFVTSTAVHVGLFILGLIAVHAVMRPVAMVHHEPKFVPTLTFGNEVKPGGLPGASIPNPTKNGQDHDRVSEPGSSPFKTTQKDAGSEKLKSMLGGPADIAAGDPINVGTKNGSLDGIGVSGTGNESPFTTPGSGGGDGDGKDMFTRGPASNPTYSAIFICDGSGSMVGGKDDKLRIELKKAVDRLSAVQSFNVLLYQQSGGKKFQSLAGQLLMAGPNNKSKLDDFVDKKMSFHGVTDPLPAIEEAFKEHPQLIYLLSDGAFENNDPDETQRADGAGVIARVAALNQDKKVHVNTILLMGSKKEVDQLKDAEDVMKKIAKENCGEYKRAFADEF